MILAASQPKGKPKFKNQFKRECRLFGAKGHKAADCWDNDKNKTKRPSNYKNRTPDNASSLQNLQKKKLRCDYFHKEGHTIENVVTERRTMIEKRVKITIWFVLPLMETMTFLYVKR
jgi:hypothetical protein